MIIIDAARERSSRVLGSTRVDLYRDGRKVRSFRLCRLSDGQAISRAWLRDKASLRTIATSFSATYWKRRARELRSETKS